MICDKCKVNFASCHIVNIISGKTVESHLCSDCAKKWTKTAGLKSKFFDLSKACIPEPIDMYREQMRQCARLNKKSFGAVSKLSGEELTRELCQLSVRHVFGLADRFYAASMKIQMLEFVQECNSALLNAATEFDGSGYDDWKDNLLRRMLSIKHRHRR